MATKLMSYVSSKGVDPYTGETYPESTPKLRTVHQIYNLLDKGFSVEERIDGVFAIPLSKPEFLRAYESELTPQPTEVITEDKPKKKENIRNNEQFK